MIPVPAPYKTPHGAQIWGIWVFSRDQNNRNSSGAYVLQSKREDKDALNAAWCPKIMDAFCLRLFARVVGKNPNTPNWTSMDVDAITRQ